MTFLEDQTNGRTRKIGRSRNAQLKVRMGLQQPLKFTHKEGMFTWDHFCR